MRRAICLLLVAMTLSSCGTFRKVFKAKESHSVAVEQSSTSNTTTQRVDKSTTTITEKIDTIIFTPGNTVVQDSPFNMDSLVNGLTAVKNDLIDVTLHLNPVTGTLTAKAVLKPRPVVVGLDRTTVKQNDIVEQSQKQEQAASKAETKDDHSTVNKEPAKMGIWLVAAIVVFLIIGAILYWRSKVR